MATIVTGFVDSPEGKHALDVAVEEAKRRGAPLVVLHSMKGGTDTSGHEVQQYRKAMEAVEDRLTEEGVGHEVVNYVLGRSPAEDVLAAAAEYDAELIVIGYRKRTAAGKALLGSHAQEILMGATCPVLAVKAP
jgi:nucleotide-binding universal stress UspA family protein